MTRLRGEDRSMTKFWRVNGFHPSRAMNYHSESSIFRQLMLLEAAQVCGVYRGDWEEGMWMSSIRNLVITENELLKSEYSAP